MWVIGLIVIIISVVGGIWGYRSSAAKGMQVQFVQTTPIGDAIEIINDMSQTDPNYRHYVEIKGQVLTNEPVFAPFSQRSVCYYRNSVASVNEETRVTYDDDGNKRVSTHKVEHEISTETSPVPFYVKDQSSPEKVRVDLRTFSEQELQEGCDRFEGQGSSFLQGLAGFASWHPYSSNRFLGYRLKEYILNLNHPVYILGEMFKDHDGYCIAQSTAAEKQHSMFSYKNEEEIVQDYKSGKNTSLIIAGIGLVIGIIICML